MQTILVRERVNTRMRDFYDIYVLVKMYESEIQVDDFRAAYEATCRKRESLHIIDNEEKIMDIVASDEKLNNHQSFHEYYDEIEICQDAAGGHYKAAIQMRNREMVDRADLVLCCIERKSGGAYQTVLYAKKHNKQIINLADGMTASCERRSPIQGQIEICRKI